MLFGVKFLPILLTYSILENTLNNLLKHWNSKWLEKPDSMVLSLGIFCAFKNSLTVSIAYLAEH